MHKSLALKVISVLNHSSEIMNFTPQYFSAFFKQSTGVCFKNYLTNIRINHAKQLLTSTDLKIIDIANMCGFNNIGSFHIIFKNITGLTPTDIRNS